MKRLSALLAITSILSAPAYANPREAALASSGDRSAVQTSVFAGATYRVGLDRRTNQRRGKAALTFAGMTQSPTAGFTVGQGLELSGGEGGKARLYLAGQEVGQLGKRANMSTGGTIAVVAGAVVLVGAIAFGAYYLDATKCDRQECE